MFYLVCKSYDITIPASWRKESDDKGALSSSSNNATSIITVTPIPDFQTLSEILKLSSTISEIPQHDGGLENDRSHDIRITYDKRDVYTCRACNVVGCTDQNVVVGAPCKLFLCEI